MRLALQIHRTGYHANDAYSSYLEMGAPRKLAPTQIAHLMELTRDLAVADRVVHSGSGGTVEVTLRMNSNDVVLVKLERARRAR